MLGLILLHVFDSFFFSLRFYTTRDRIDNGFQRVLILVVDRFLNQRNKLGYNDLTRYCTCIDWTHSMTVEVST